jgi:6,7-dimethyl-8-ribityllumazine synthase
MVGRESKHGTNMSVQGRTLKVLVAQARFNSQIITALGILAKNSAMGGDKDRFIEALQAAADQSSAFVDALNAAVDGMVGDADA